MARTRTAARAVRTARSNVRAAGASPEAPAARAATDPGYITVRIGLLPGMINTIALNGGRKVKDALAGANLNPNGYEIKVQAAPATIETDLKQDDTVLLVRKVKGNA